MAEELKAIVGQPVVLDTASPMVYLGTLVSVEANGLWLEDADVHHTHEGHATREQYITESAIDGVRVNRRRVFVYGSTILSVSRLVDVVAD